MKKYIVYVERKKVNEFEVEAENKSNAESIVRDLLNRTSILNCKIFNMVPTEVSINAKREHKKIFGGKILNYNYQRGNQ